MIYLEQSGQGLCTVERIYIGKIMMNGFRKEKRNIKAKQEMQKYPRFREILILCFSVLLFGFYIGTAYASEKEGAAAPKEETAASTEERTTDIPVPEEAETEDTLAAEGEWESITNPEAEDDIDNYSADEILADYDPESLELPSGASMEVSADDWNLLLVNNRHPIPEDYEFTLGTIRGSLQCDERIIPEFLSMLQEAKKDGITLEVCSPYRTLERQEYLFDRKIRRYMNQGMSYMDAYKLSARVVNVPGTSEHQIGLALDIYTNSYKTLDEGFGETPAGIWLRDNCAEYGFILRYPKGIHNGYRARAMAFPVCGQDRREGDHGTGTDAGRVCGEPVARKKQGNITKVQ